MPVGILSRQINTDPKGVDAYDLDLNDTSDQAWTQLTPFLRRKFMDISTFYHDIPNHSLETVSRLNN